MSDTVIKVENLYKEYRLGVVNHGTLRHDLGSWWAKVRGKEDPNSLLTAHLQLTPNPSLEKRGEKDIDEELRQHFLALSDISFEVKQGDVLGIIGRNGAGKSTLLKILSRITSPTAGRVRIKGRMASLLEVGTGFHPELTGRENVYMNGAILGMRRWEITRKMDEIISFAGLEKFINTPVKRYSSGMYVRLAFAVAAHLDAEILVLDEVLAVGDAEFQKKCLGKMDDVAKKQGRTILFVSHNMAAVSALCAQGMVLHQGRKEFHGEVNQAVNQYLHKKISIIQSDLALRKDRQGTGRIRFVKTWLENAKGEKIDNVRVGETVTIAAQYLKKAPESLKNVTISFAINSINDIPITDFSNLYAGEVENTLQAEQGTMRCTIERFPFNVGTYTYNICAKTGNQLEDWIIEAGIFDVEFGDFYGSGRIPDNSRLFVVPQKWLLTDK